MGVKKKNLDQPKPILFSDHFGVDAKKLEELGVFNPILNCDTKLFVEPLLLKSSKSPLIKESYLGGFINFFEELLMLIKASKVADETDIHWRTAKQRITFPEYKSTCIGYGDKTIGGKGSSRSLNEKILKNALDIAESGQENPKMFTILPFLEEGVGGDIISDMTQKIIDNEICKYTRAILEDIGLEGDYNYTTECGASYNLLFNPFSKCELKFLPQDILTNLALADSFDGWIVNLTQVNSNLRRQVNRVIGTAWLEKSKAEKKEDILNELKTNKEFFLEVVKIITSEDFSHYDLKEDHQGIYRWFKDSKSVISKNDLTITPIAVNSQESLNKAVSEIISNFRSLIENGEIWRLFWTKHNSKMYHVNEVYSQMLFYMSSQMWLDAQSSPINLKRQFSFEDTHLCIIFSLGRKFRTMVQIKHSSNGGLSKIYERQVEFCQSKNISGFYAVINFKEEDSNQYEKIKSEENSNCKIIRIDAAEDCLEQSELDFMTQEEAESFKDIYIGFDNIPSNESLYFAEKSKGGKNSGKKYDDLRNKAHELCRKELKTKKYPSALQLCLKVSQKIEEDHKHLLGNFPSYKKHLKDNAGWTKPTFYTWCNDIFKEAS